MKKKQAPPPAAAKQSLRSVKRTKKSADITERKKEEIRLVRLNDCFLRFGVSPEDNINRLVAACGEMMNAACALYNRLEKNLLCSIGQWQTPAGFKSKDKPNGHICYDVIQQGGEHPLLVRNLQESPYARTDPNVLPYGLQTYIGIAVKWKQAAIGSLCVVYQTDIIPSKDDLRFMTIIASAIAVEEDRLHGEEALRRSEENFRRFLDESPLGVRIVTEEGETIYVNPAMLKMYGYDSIEELRTTPLKKRYTPESYAKFQIRREKRKQGVYTPSEYEVSIVRKDGEVRHLHVFRKEILWDGVKQFQAMYQDITEHQQAEDALRKSEEEYRTLFEESFDGLFITSPEGRILDMNKKGVMMFGYDTKEEILSLDLARNVYAHPQDRKRVLPLVNAQGAAEYEVIVKKKNGEPMITHCALTAVKDKSGGIASYRGIIRDITERKRVEEDLLASREQLRALAGRLQAVREEERTEIAREIHDELGGALTGMKVDVSFLKKSFSTINDEAVRTSLFAGIDAINKSIGRTIQIVRKIAMELRPGVLDDLGLIAALEWQLKDFEKRTGIRCDFFPPRDDISFDADLSTALFRIFQEALTNVARHSGATDVHVRLRADADSYSLDVEDNGKGIEKKKVLSPKSLGLLGMRERAQTFGGRISVTGTPGMGTTVTVEISPIEKRKLDRHRGGNIG